ncbi:hypothetical protein QJS66_10905 [Kocuria rhizophila]|nr:hypothetical protein QJS66_10905 [Kocuria rhizophila]
MINGDDVTGMDGGQAAPYIGHANQAGGLFPHMTVGRTSPWSPRC